MLWGQELQGSGAPGALRRQPEPEAAARPRQAREQLAAVGIPSTASSRSGPRTKEQMLERGYDPSCGLKAAGHSHDPQGDDSGKAFLLRAMARAKAHNARRLRSHSGSRSARSGRPARAKVRESTDTRESRSTAVGWRVRSHRPTGSSATRGTTREPRELGVEGCPCELGSGRATDHDYVDARAEPASIGSKPLTNPPFHAVAHHRRAHLATDRNPQSIVACILGCIPSLRNHHDEGCSCHATTSPDYLLELHRPPQAIHRLETAGSRRHRYFDGVETAMRLRPFARRRFSTARPAAVCMRLRKPWTRLRRIRLG